MLARALELPPDSVFEELLLAVVRVVHPDEGKINHVRTSLISVGSGPAVYT